MTAIKSTVKTCDCDYCGGPVYLDYSPEPGQVMQCETCWEIEGERAAEAGEYAQAW